MISIILSGVLTASAFIFKKLYIIEFISLVPIFFILTNKKYNFKEIFSYGFFFSASLNAVVLIFLFKAYPLDFLSLNNFLSFLLIFLFYIFIISLEGIFTGFAFVIYKKYVNNIYAFPIIYVAFEIIRGFGILGYTFSDLYLPFAQNKYLIQISSHFSCYAVSLLILYINILIYKFLKDKKIRYILILFIIILSDILYGNFKINLNTENTKEISVMAVQGNISSKEKWKNSNIYKIINNYDDITKKALAEHKPDIIIWPETVVPIGISKSHNIYYKYKDLAREYNSLFLTGAFLKTDTKSSNSIITFDNKGNISKNIYNKRFGIPFAERGINYGIKVGGGDNIIKSGPYKIGCFICIDSCYPFLSYETKKENPDFLITLTNDSWFDNSYLLELHNYHNIYRSIEIGKPFIQCSNTGITNVISKNGIILNRIKANEKSVLFEKIIF